jgi:hypothetical protein
MRCVCVALKTYLFGITENEEWARGTVQQVVIFGPLTVPTDHSVSVNYNPAVPC